jgi:hypothetical protein
VRQLLCGPRHEAFALVRKQRGQVGGALRFAQHRLLAAADVVVDQRQVHLGQLARLAQQVAVHAQLRPVQVAVVGGDAGKLAAVGLDLFKQVLRRVVAVGAAAHRERPVLAAERHLGLVAGTAPAGDDTMSGDAFLGCGRGREAQVEVALFGGELAQRPHCNDVTQAACSHCR